MSARRFAFALVLAALGAGILGLLLPAPTTPASATHINVYLRVHPGPDGPSATLNCGWHGSCGSSPTSGTSLDWRNNYFANQPVHWRSWGYRSDVSAGDIGYGVIVQNDGGTCSAVDTELRDIFGFQKGFMRYTHSRTWTPDTEFTVRGGSGWIYGVHEIGFSWETDFANCLSQGLYNCAYMLGTAPNDWCVGQHLHQVAQTGYFYRNTGVYPNYINAGSYSIVLQANWQYGQDWYW